MKGDNRNIQDNMKTNRLLCLERYNTTFSTFNNCFNKYGFEGTTNKKYGKGHLKASSAKPKSSISSFNIDRYNHVVHLLYISVLWPLVLSLKIFVCILLSTAFLGWIVSGDVWSLILPREDIWHPGGFHGYQDSIQDGRHFICPYQSFYMFYNYKAQTYIDLNVLRMWSPYMELLKRHPKKVTKGQGHIKVNTWKKC